MKTSRRRKNTKPLRTEDWNFQSCPRYQLPYCFEYEFARAMVQQDTSGTLAADLRSLDAYTKKGLLVNSFLQAIIREFPEFHAKPWLAIPQTVRDKRLKMLPVWDVKIPGENRDYAHDETGRLVPTIKGDGAFAAERLLVPPKRGDIIAVGNMIHRTEHGGLPDDGPVIWDAPKWGEPEYRHEAFYVERGCLIGYHVVRINWSLPDTHSAAGLARHIKRMRPELLKLFSPCQLVNGNTVTPLDLTPQGKTGINKQPALLKQLGAKRLLDSGLTPREAEILTAPVWKDSKGNLGSMYQSEESWFNARQDAERTISRFRQTRLHISKTHL